MPFFLYGGGFEEDLYVLPVRKRGEPERGGGKFIHMAYLTYGLTLEHGNAGPDVEQGIVNNITI
jgi:hypothetical protein